VLVDGVVIHEQQGHMISANASKQQTSHSGFRLTGLSRPLKDQLSRCKLLAARAVLFKKKQRTMPVGGLCMLVLYLTTGPVSSAPGAQACAAAQEDMSVSNRGADAGVGPAHAVPVQLPTIDLPENGDESLPLATRQRVVRALLTAIMSVHAPRSWVVEAAHRARHVEQRLRHFLSADYEVLRVALSMLPDDGMLAVDILNDLLKDQ
jgi:hypothetical protein